MGSLGGEDFFDATRYPRITYRASNVRFDGDLPVALEGQLTMHGVTQPLVLEVSGFRCTTHPLAGGKRCGAQARGTLRRRPDLALERAAPVDGRPQQHGGAAIEARQEQVLVVDLAHERAIVERLA